MLETRKPLALYNDRDLADHLGEISLRVDELDTITATDRDLYEHENAERDALFIRETAVQTEVARRGYRVPNRPWPTAEEVRKLVREREERNAAQMDSRVAHTFRTANDFHAQHPDLMEVLRDGGDAEIIEFLTNACDADLLILSLRGAGVAANAARILRSRSDKSAHRPLTDPEEG